ncbi:MAG: hypothetical protein ACOX1I_02140 [Dethiobacteria bacterium]
MFQQKIVPMEPQPSKVLQEDPGLFYQVKWDGVRILAFGEGGYRSSAGEKSKKQNSPLSGVSSIA